MKKTSLRSPLLLLLTAVIWGVAFVAQSVGMDYVGGFTFNCVRSIIGGAVLIPCIFFLDRWKVRDAKKSSSETAAGSKRSSLSAENQSNKSVTAAVKKGNRPEKAGNSVEEKKAQNKTLLLGGICCGVALCIASNLQQFGIKYTTVGKAGFITAMYIIIVPVIGIFLEKTTGLRIWVSVLLAVGGLYLLCMTEGFSIAFGDLLVLLCAVMFSVHILVIDYFSPKVDGVRMSCIQFFVSGILSGVAMLIFEQPNLGAILQAWMPILYAGVMSCGVAYTLQIVGQKDMDPTIASLILSLESVVSVLAGWVILGQKLSSKELFGCVLMFAAIILAQLPDRKMMISVTDIGNE